MKLSLFEAVDMQVFRSLELISAAMQRAKDEGSNECFDWMARGQ